MYCRCGNRVEGIVGKFSDYCKECNKAIVESLYELGVDVTKETKNENPKN